MNKKVVSYLTIVPYWSLAGLTMAGNAWGTRAFIFIAWLSLVSGFLSYMTSEKAKEVPDTHVHRIPSKLHVVIDLIGAVCLAGFGHWFLGLVAIVDCVFWQGAASVIEEKQRKAKNAKEAAEAAV